MSGLWQIGEFVRVGPSLGVAVPLPSGWVFRHGGDHGLDHVGVWYGEYEPDGRPRVKTVPIEYVERAGTRNNRLFRPASTLG